MGRGLICQFAEHEELGRSRSWPVQLPHLAARALRAAAIPPFEVSRR